MRYDTRMRLLSARDDDDACGVNPQSDLGLRVGALFIILATSCFGTFFPVLTKRTAAMRKLVPAVVFEFAKFFGSGVITATALIHLLEPAADDELGPANTFSLGGCISDSWANYPYAFGICLASLFFTFVSELFAFRIGTAYLAKRGIDMNPTHGMGTIHDAHQDSLTHPGISETQALTDPQIQTEKARAELTMDAKDSASIGDERWQDASENHPAVAQILGVAILEFGVLFHSVIIGLTLSLSSPDDFTTLFIVIIFHQMFEGLGLGTRLAFLKLPREWSWAPYVGAGAYTLMTPIGMAIGLGVRTSARSLTSESASIASGVLDSISAGILLYAATVELIAHEFIFNKYYHTCSNARVIFVLCCFALGAGLMALLGKWA